MSEAAEKSGLRQDRLNHLLAVMRDDVARGRYHGGVICVGRHGHLGVHAAVGHGYRDQKTPLTTSSVFSIFSTTKAFTNVLVFRAVERGELAFTTRVSSVIPEFSGGEREQLTVYHLMTHSTGIGPVFTPKPGMFIDQLDEIIAAICENVHAEGPAGEKVNYSPMVAHALLGEMVRRVDPAKRRYRDLVQQELFGPLGMRDSSIGLRKDLRDRKIVPDFLGGSPIQHLGHSNLGPNGAFEEEEAEMPWVGAVCSAHDLYRFAECMRQGGALDGARIIGPAILDLATRNRTGDKPNELYMKLAQSRGWAPYPAYIGIGFSLRGEAVCHHQFGTLTSPRTFGNHGAGSTLFWVDPQLDMSFACLTAGVMNEADNIERFQRLSDVAVSAAV
ncbi:MAG TPA: serine hydrolase domain-containing protein [Steroidobacteraceae bacterium]|nr:serine hydrolase domain-containing protein [Steroidobacteraceae bacterium]